MAPSMLWGLFGTAESQTAFFDVSIAGEQPISTKYLVYHRLIFLFTIQKITMEECREALAISE